MKEQSQQQRSPCVQPRRNDSKSEFVVQEMPVRVESTTKFLRVDAPRGVDSPQLRRTWQAGLPTRWADGTTWQVQLLNKFSISTCQSVQRQAPMVQTVLGVSAAAVHRQGHRDSCLDVEPDPSGTEDAEDHGESTVCNTPRRRSMSLLSRIEQGARALVELQSVASPETQNIDRAVNFFWCHRDKCRPYRGSRRPGALHDVAIHVKCL